MTQQHTHVLTHGEHYRNYPNDKTGNPVPPEVIKTGQAFTPTPQELKAFPDKIALIGGQITVPALSPTIKVEAKPFTEEEEALADAMAKMTGKAVWKAVEEGEMLDTKVLGIELKTRRRKGLVRRLQERIEKQK